MLVKNLNEEIIEIGKLGLEAFKKANGGVIPPGFLGLIESREYNKNGNVYYFTTEESFKSYCKINYDAICLAVCLEMIEGNNERYWNIYKSCALENNPIKLINIVADRILLKQLENAFPLYNSKELEDFRSRLLLLQRDEYEVLYNPNENDMTDFEKNWLREEQKRIAQVFTAVENSSDIENSRVERTACIVVLNKYKITIEKAIEKFAGEICIKTETVRNGTEITFESFLINNGTKIFDYLIKTYQNTKPKNIGYMLFALKDLKLIDEETLNSSQNQTELHRALTNSFGKIGSRQQLSNNISTLGAISKANQSKVQIHRQAIKAAFKNN